MDQWARKNNIWEQPRAGGRPGWTILLLPGMPPCCGWSGTGFELPCCPCCAAGLEGLFLSCALWNHEHHEQSAPGSWVITLLHYKCLPKGPIFFFCFWRCPPFMKHLPQAFCSFTPTVIFTNVFSCKGMWQKAVIWTSALFPLGKNPEPF